MMMATGTRKAHTIKITIIDFYQFTLIYRWINFEEEAETSFLDSGDVDMETWGLSRRKFMGHTEKTKSTSLRQNRYNSVKVWAVDYILRSLSRLNMEM